MQRDSFFDTLAARARPRSYPRNTIVVQEGDRGDQLFLVLEGRLKVFLADADGKEVIIDVLGPRDYFGELALNGEPRSASVMTTEPTRLAVVERDAFKEFLAEAPESAFEFIVTLIHRARHLTRSVGNLALLDVYGRVARFLLDAAIEDGGRLVVRGHASQQEIAKRVNASREMVSRILSDLREGGYIALERDEIVLQQRLPKRW